MSISKPDLAAAGFAPVALEPKPSFRVGALYERAPLVKAGIITAEGQPGAVLLRKPNLVVTPDS